MRIVNRHTFRGLPSGTLFSKYRPQYFDDVCIKGETWEQDFLYQVLTDPLDDAGSIDRMEKLFAREEDGKSFGLDFNSMSRDGMFDADQLFAVWEKADVEGLISRLQEALKDGYAT